MHQLFGDGIHDDTLAIQELINSGVREVVLPEPKVRYLISKPLELPSNFRLILPRYAEIKLADGSNCVMVKNKTVDKPEHRVEGELWSFVNQFDPDYVCKNIELRGGIWNCNNLNQVPNPIWTRVFEPKGYTGFGMLFFGVEFLKIRDMTIKDPVNFAVTLDRVSWFTVEDVDFDFNYGNPIAGNMDGIHLNGNCHHGIIRNLKGSCYDDMVALNADEGSDGPITDIEIAGLWGTDSHSAVRLLTVKNPVENIHIHDVYGTFYQYCIGVTKFYPGEATGHYAGISLDHIYASKAERLSVYMKDGSYVYPVIYIQGKLHVKDLSLRHVYRKELDTPVETVHVGPKATVEVLDLQDIHTENYTGQAMPLLRNLGTIQDLYTTKLYPHGDPLLINEGTIENMKEN